VKYEDIVAFARIFHRDYKDLWISHPDSTEVAPLDDIVDVGKVCEAVARKVNRDVEVLRIFSDTPNHYGEVRVYNDKSQIRLWAGLNRCWHRFVWAKECMHIVFPKWDGFTPVQRVEHALNSRFAVAKTGYDFDVETTGIYLAMEVLIPWGIRGRISGWKHEDRETNYQIACRLLVPQEAINFFFDLGFAEQSAKFNKQFDQRASPRVDHPGI